MSTQNQNLDPNSEQKKDEDIQDEEINSDESEDINQEESELEKYKKQAEENLAGWQRAKADFLNYKKDQEKFLEEFRKYANEDMIIKLLPTIDSFNLATEHLPEDLKDNDWAKGIMCIKNQFDNFLKDANVEEIKSIGKKFDPSLYESIGEEESEKEEGTIIMEVQKGYKMFGKVIRAGKVKVGKKK
jgi:molecular chaperone GrpE